jgi:hypothetical protein
MGKGIGFLLIVLLFVLVFGGCMDMKCAIDRGSSTRGGS